MAGGRSLKLMTLNNFIDKLLQYKDQHGEKRIVFYNSDAEAELFFIDVYVHKPIDGWGNEVADAEEEVTIYIER